MSALRVVFMGTPAFAVPGLEALFEAGCDVVGVVTQPDKPAGRGQEDTKPPVAKAALRHGLTPLQWPRLSDVSYAALRALEAELFVVVAYGKVLPQRYLDLPRHGCLNVHASLLPRWRGAAPIQRAVMAGDARTGVCVMQMEAGLDTGPVCHRLTTDIGPDETSSALHDRLSVLGAQGLSEVLARLVTNGLTFEAQSLDGVTYANRLEKGDGRIDFTQDARAVHDLVRGVHPWPGGFVDRSDGPLKIQSTRLATAAEVPTSDLQEAATVLAPAADGPIISCGRGAVVLTSLQRPGRRVISGAEFLRGARDLSPGMRL